MTAEQKTPVQRLAALAYRVRREGLPPELRADAARRVLDVLGNSLAATAQPPARAVGELVAEWGGAERATAIGTGTRLPEPSAALLNGTLAHSLDFDDTHLPSVLHPSASVVPAALAVAEARGASGAALLDAAGAGVEITVRLGMAGYDRELGNSVFFERGQHATAICGALGAAAAAAMLSGLDAGGIADALGIAASMGSGILEANRTGGTVKRVHCGWAAHAGVTAAGLARTGITGPPTVLEGRFGLLQAFCGDRADPGAITDRLGEHWELPGVFFKPYPCNHFTHAGIDAALRLRERGLDPADIADIELGAPAPVLRTIGEPAEDKARPESGYHAAFSGPYTVAAALLGGGGLGVSHEDFTDEAAADPARFALAAKVRCVPDARCDAIFPHRFPAVLRVRTRAGALLEERVDTNRGGPDNPLSPDELAAKFELNATRRVTPAAAARITELTYDLAALDKLDALTSLLR
ncbi:MmgE/PrpD family protein [Actinomadura livida]|uniref:2-methylcitrate dehydratase PrpD n=1 Tax=Actinomadura livida TaxID=79909 RepID=A0A7W7I8Y7_9ACTN|nr:MULTISPECIES: MmgE/PrpD family protein [Actinomadura]MBB4772650.1 2-methylcitrate dehydratase PrpD [Actinomadura catellatispora]GGU11880.1 MmgE/Prp family protein [Actinomadura livida]